MSELVDGHTQVGGGLAQGVRRPARPLQGIAREPEQPAATLGLHHVLGGEAEAVQVFDQRGTLARIGDSGGLKRIEIDHYSPPRRMSKAITGSSKPLSVNGSCAIASHAGTAVRTTDEARIWPGNAAATNRAAKFTTSPK